MSDGNLLPILVSFASWRTCRCCGSQTLYIDARLQADDDCVCGLCERRRNALGAELRVLALVTPSERRALDRAIGRAGGIQ